MKILCVIDSLGSGGAQRQLVGLADLLHEHGYEVKVIWYHADGFYKEFLDAKGVDYENIVAGKRWSKWKKVYHEIREYKPDQVIAYLDGAAMIVCMARILLGKRFRLIVSERNTTQILNWHEKIKFFLYRWADYVVSNSYSQYEFINRNFGHLRKKSVVITNFVDTSYFKPLPQLHKYTDEIRILVVARMEQQKNVLRFLEAAKSVKTKGYRFRVDWYGDAFSMLYRQRCLDYCRELGLEDCFVFHKAEKDILPIYQQADVFCLPSLFEGFPNVVCEAMSCGLPVLCGNVCDNGRIVQADVNGYLFNPREVGDIVRAMIEFIGLPEERKRELGAMSRKIAERDFSADSFVGKYIEIL